MTKSLEILLATLFLLLPASLRAGGRKDDDIRDKAVAAFSVDKLYVGQVVDFTLTLYTDYPEIQGFNIIEGLESSNLKKITNTPRPQISRRPDKKGMYSVDVIKTALVASEPGECTIDGGVLQVNYISPDSYYDPFFGYMGGRTLRRQLDFGSVSIKARKLPKAPDGFSGAVGDFSISVDYQDVEMGKDSEVAVSYIVEGYGLLQDVAMPDFPSIFPKGLKMKNVTSDSQVYMENGRIVSRLVYECLFSSADYGNYTLSPLRFIYFDPYSGKYKTIMSPEVTVDVKSGRNSFDGPGQYVLLPLNDNVHSLCHD